MKNDEGDETVLETTVSPRRGQKSSRVQDSTGKATKLRPSSADVHSCTQRTATIKQEPALRVNTRNKANRQRAQHRINGSIAKIAVKITRTRLPKEGPGGTPRAAALLTSLQARRQTRVSARGAHSQYHHEGRTDVHVCTSSPL